jgi:hypothetical protein
VPSTSSVSGTGFLDTFDPFDSSCAELPRDFLDLALLSFASVLACDLLFGEKCNRVTDAPEIEETTLWAHFPQPSSVPIQARP